MSEGFNIEIGCERFQIGFRIDDHRLLNDSKKILRNFCVSPLENCCRVEVIPYSRHQSFPWDLSESDRFREYFIDIHRRFPANSQPEEIAGSCLGILQHLDPEEERIRHIQARIDESSTLIYSRLMSDIYFFDTESRIAFFFIKRRNRRSYMVSGIMNGLMFVLSHLLICHKGLLVHGAAVQRDNRTVLFLGLSGSGKTTISNLCRPDVCFSDDGVVIRKENDRLYVYRSPFTQVRRGGKYPGLIKGEIEKIFLLEKGNHHKIVPLRKDDLMITILMYLIHFFKYLNDETARAGFCVVKGILDTVPSCRLEFAKRGKIWEEIMSSLGRG